MKFLGLDRVLCLSPHPDDAEYAMGATVLKHSDTEFVIYTMSSGSKGDRYDGAKRLNEVRDFWSLLCRNVSVFFSAAEFIGDIDEEGWIHEIEDALDGDFDAVMAPPSDDTHYEHVLTNRVARAACRQRPMSFIEYCSPSAYINWVPNILVDVSQEFESKRTALRKFSSQVERPYFSGAVLDTYHRNMQAGRKGILYVERFRAVEVYR